MKLIFAVLIAVNIIWWPYIGFIWLVTKLLSDWREIYLIVLAVAIPVFFTISYIRARLAK